MHEDEAARQQRLAYEKILYRYSVALESGDLETIIALLHDAESNTYLEHMIIETHQEGYQKEEHVMQSNAANGQSIVSLYETTTSYQTPLLSSPPQRILHKRWFIVLQNVAVALIVGILIVSALVLFTSHNKTTGVGRSTVTGGAAKPQENIVVTASVSGTAQTGVITAMNPQTGLSLWHYSLGTNVDYNARIGLVLQDHVVYLAYNKQVQAFQVHDGKLLWKTTLGKADQSNTDTPPQLIVDHGQIYASGYVGGNLYTLNAKTGKMLWYYSASIPALLTVNNGVAYVRANNDNNNNAVKALDKKNGHELWHYPTTEPLGATIANNVLYVQSVHSLVNDPIGMHKEQKPLIALNATTGQLIWSTIATAHGPSPLVVAQGVVFLFDNGHFCGYHTTNGKQAMCTTEPTSIINGAGLVSSYNTVYGLYARSFTSDFLEAIDPNNGKVLWSNAVNGLPNPSIIALGDSLIIPGTRQLEVVSRINGRILWQTSTLGFMLSAAAGN